MRIQLFTIFIKGGIIPLFIFLFSSHVLFAQGGFQKFYQIPGSINARSSHAIEVPNGGYIVVGESQQMEENVAISKLVLIGTDTEGNFQWQKTYGSSVLSYPSNLFQGKYIFCLEADHFYYCGPVKDSLDNYFTTLMKFDYNGGLSWSKMYSDTTGDLVPMGLTKAVDGGFYLIGTSLPNFGGQPIFISRLSSNGDELWKKIINKGPPNVAEVKLIIQDSATKRLFAPGYQYLGSGTNNCLLITDSLGNKIKQFTYNDPCGGPASSLIQLRDKNFLIDNNLGVDCFNGIKRAGLVKIDNNGGFLWSYEQPSTGPSNSFNVIEERPNGDVVVTGYVDSTYDVHAQYMVITNKGKLRLKKSFGRIKKDLKFDYLRGGMVTKDGGYVVAIQLTHESDPTRFSFAKVDSLGCDSTPEYCAWELAVGLKYSEQLLRVSVFPNPCNEVLNIVAYSTFKTATMNVADGSGRQVMSNVVDGRSFKIPTSDLAPGIYLLELRTANGVFRSNFVVQR